MHHPSAFITLLEMAPTRAAVTSGVRPETRREVSHRMTRAMKANLNCPSNKLTVFGEAEKTDISTYIHHLSIFHELFREYSFTDC